MAQEADLLSVCENLGSPQTGASPQVPYWRTWWGFDHGWLSSPPSAASQVSWFWAMWPWKWTMAGSSCSRASARMSSGAMALDPWLVWGPLSGKPNGFLSAPLSVGAADLDELLENWFSLGVFPSWNPLGVAVRVCNYCNSTRESNDKMLDFFLIIYSTQTVEWTCCTVSQVMTDGDRLSLYPDKVTHQHQEVRFVN